MALPLALTFSSCVSTKGGSLERALNQQEAHVSAGDHQKAIDGYKKTLREYPDEETVIKSCIQSLEGIKASADKAHRAKKFTSAIQTYTLLSKNYHHFASFEKSLSFDAKDIALMLKNSQIEQSTTLAADAVKSGDYLRAVEAYSGLLQSYPGDQLLKRRFIATVTTIYRTGETAFKSGQLVVAGNAYSALLRTYALLVKSDVSLPFSNKSLENGLDESRNLLLRKGLEKYRNEDLKAAISIWKDILKFDPDNVEIKKAIENAESQLKKIKEKSRNQH